MDKQNLIKEKVAEWLDTLPIKDHIKEWKILFSSTLMPAKNGVEHTAWDMKLYSHLIDQDDTTLYLVIGVKIK